MSSQLLVSTWQEKMELWPKGGDIMREDLPLHMQIQFPFGGKGSAISSFQRFIRQAKRYSATMARTMTAGPYAYANFTIEFSKPGCLHFDLCGCVMTLKGRNQAEGSFFVPRQSSLTNQFMQMAEFLTTLKGNRCVRPKKDLEFRWEEIGTVQELPDSFWATDPTAGDYLREKGIESEIAFYCKAELFPRDWSIIAKCHIEKVDIHVLMKIDQTFYLAMGLPQELYDLFPCIVRPSHIPIWQRVLKSTEVPDGELNNYFYCELEVKPEIRVLVRQGKIKSVLSTHNEGGHTWHYCEKPWSISGLEAPEIVGKTWMAEQFRHREQFSLVFEGEKLPKVEWPFTLRTFKRQIQHVVDMLAPNAKLIVPTDPLDAMRHFWTGPMFVGRKANIGQTMYEQNKEDNVLLLLDTYKDMTEGEQGIVQMWRGPIFIISCGNAMPFFGLTHLAPGIHASLTMTKSVPMSWKQQQEVRSELRCPDDLLLEKGIKAMSGSLSVQYWRGMRPYMEWQHPQADPLAHDIHELGTIWQMQGQVPVYFAHIASRVENPTPVREGAYQTLYFRTVYSIPERHSMVTMVMENSHYARFGGYVIFVPNETGTWYFSPWVQGPLDHFQFCGAMNSSIQVSSEKGWRKWDISHPYHRWLVVTYFTAWPGNSWKVFLDHEARIPVAFKLQDVIQGFAPLLEISPMYWRGAQGMTLQYRMKNTLVVTASTGQPEGYLLWDAIWEPPPEGW